MSSGHQRLLTLNRLPTPTPTPTPQPPKGKRADDPVLRTAIKHLQEEGHQVRVDGWLTGWFGGWIDHEGRVWFSGVFLF